MRTAGGTVDANTEMANKDSKYMVARNVFPLLLNNSRRDQAAVA